VPDAPDGAITKIEYKCFPNTHLHVPEPLHRELYLGGDSGSGTDPDTPDLVPRRGGWSSDDDSDDSGSETDPDMPDLVPRQAGWSLDDDDDDSSSDGCHTGIRTDPREPDHPLCHHDIENLIRLEDTIKSFIENGEHDACNTLLKILTGGNPKQLAATKNDKKTSTPEKGTSAEKKSSPPSKFDAIRKKLEEKGKKKLESNAATPQVTITSTTPNQDQDRADKVYTMGTECNCIIAWVGKYKNSNAPAYTRPFYNRLNEDDALRRNCKIHLLALRRSQTNGATNWSYSQWNREQTREYTLYWQLYIRFLEPSEPNTTEFRTAWGISLTEILNRFGSGYPIPQKNKYEADLGKGVLGDYCTYPVTFRRIEQTYFPLRFSNEDIADDTDLLNLYFGDNEDDIERARSWYRTRCGLDAQPPPIHNVAEVDDMADIAKNIF
jgi:hypothetical protein